MKKAYSACWACKGKFWYGVDTVPSVPVDRWDAPAEKPEDVHRLAPICPPCVGEINRERAEHGAPLFEADPYAPRIETPAVPPRTTNAYLVVNGEIIRREWEIDPWCLNPVAGLPRDLQPHPAPLPHLDWTYDDGRRECLPWCWCEIEKDKQKGIA